MTAGAARGAGGTGAGETGGLDRRQFDDHRGSGKRRQGPTGRGRGIRHRRSGGLRDRHRVARMGMPLMGLSARRHQGRGDHHDRRREPERDGAGSLHGAAGIARPPRGRQRPGVGARVVRRIPLRRISRPTSLLGAAPPAQAGTPRRPVHPLNQSAINLRLHPSRDLLESSRFGWSETVRGELTLCYTTGPCELALHLAFYAAQSGLDLSVSGSIPTRHT